MAIHIRRRKFVTLLGGTVAAWPLTTSAQPTKPPTIGFIVVAPLTSERDRIAAFSQRLRELGWVEGRNIAIDFRAAEARPERLSDIAAELVRLKVDVIVTYSTPAVIAAKQATSAIPIIFATSSDPVGTGLVASLARPGGNVTGLSNQQADTAGKRLELLREVLPSLRRLAIMGDVGNPALASEMSDIQATARRLGLDTITAEIRRAEDIAPAFAAFQGRAEALYITASPLVNANRTRINIWALAARVPTIYANRENIEVGGLMSYGPSFPDLFRRAADIVDRVLRGTKPADIPVEQPTKFDLVLNLITAQALGVTIPAGVLAIADEVIE
jgi:putative ABC transport system substrate-binding protein